MPTDKRYLLKDVRRHPSLGVIGTIIEEDTGKIMVSGRISEVLASGKKHGYKLTNQDDVERLLDRA